MNNQTKTYFYSILDAVSDARIDDIVIVDINKDVFEIKEEIKQSFIKAVLERIYLNINYLNIDTLKKKPIPIFVAFNRID